MESEACASSPQPAAPTTTQPTETTSLLTDSSSGTTTNTPGEQHPAKKPRTEMSAQPALLSPSPPASIPPSTPLLTQRVKKELHGIWAAARHPPQSVDSTATTTTTVTTATVAAPDVATVIPPFKVGTLEMYRRFPDAYDLLMHHHNCSAVQTTLLHDILGRIVNSAATAAQDPDNKPQQQQQQQQLPPSSSKPWVRVADFGCGTGRIEEMVAQHPAVAAIYAYDGEAAMLKPCLVNTVRSAAQAKHCGGIRLYPVATTAAAPLTPFVELCSSGGGGGGDTCGNSSSAYLDLCVRPVPFQAVQDGFLASTHHPTCSLMVCAWSLSYVMRQQWGDDHWHAAVDAVVNALIEQLDTTTSDAAVVIIETLGNGSTEPTRQNTYMQRLEEHFGFTRTWVRTDYEFATITEAERMVRFFFGPKMLPRVTVDKDGVSCRLMECTGMWTLWKPKQP